MSSDVEVTIAVEPPCGQWTTGEVERPIEYLTARVNQIDGVWYLVSFGLFNGNGPEFGPPCIDAPVPVEFVGSWSGTGEQTNPPGEWPVQLTLNGGEFGSVGAAEYPSLGCAGNLALSSIDAAPSAIVLTETLTSGWETCVDRGTFHLTPTESGSLQFGWSSPDGASTAEGTLTRVPPDIQTFAGSPEDAAVELSLLEAAHDYDALYDRLHPDARSVVPREAVVGWYREFLAGKETAQLTVTGVRYVDWTWPVTGATYPNTAEVDFDQPYWENGVQTDVADTVRLVEHPGGWGWFFGRSREFVDEQIARFPPTGPDLAAPELRVELTVTGPPPPGTVFALSLGAPDAAPLICVELTDPDGDGVSISGNLANQAWPPGSEGYAFYNGVLLHGTEYLGSDAPGGRTSCFAGEGMEIARFSYQPVVEDTVLRASASFEEAPPSSPATIAYTVTDLGTLGNWSRALGLNNHGQVVGVTDTTIPPDIGESNPARAFLWEGGTMTDLGSLSLGAGGSSAEDINDAGQIVGDTDTVKLPAAPGPLPHAFLWEQGVLTNLGTLAGNASHASAINSSGQIVGRSRLESSAGPIHAFIVEAGQMTDLGTLGGIDSNAVDINDAGWIVGSASTANGDTHAALWRDNAITDLGVLPGHTVSAASAINAQGTVVGHSYDGSEPFSPVQAFVWSAAGGGLTELVGLPDAYQTYAHDVNVDGNIVGSSGFRGDTVGVDDEMRAFLFRDGAVVDLNTLIDPASGWVLIAAHAINDRGQIVGVGTVAGTLIPYPTRAFLLTPTDQPAGEPVLPEPAAPELRVELTVIGTPPAGTVFALNLGAAAGSSLHCVQLTDPDGDGVYISNNYANEFSPTPNAAAYFYGGAVLYGTEYLGSDLPQGRTSCFAGEDTLIAAFDHQPVFEDTVLRATVTFEDAAPYAPAAIAYSVTDLGSLGNWSRASGLNSQGQVVGVTDTTHPQDFRGSVERAFLWTVGEMVDLGTLNSAGGASRAMAVNDSGLVAGDADTAFWDEPSLVGRLPNAFLWQDGLMQRLGTSWFNSYGEAINVHGQVVGRFTMGGGVSPRHAYVYDSGQITELSTLGGMDSAAWDINDTGWVVGGASTPAEEYHATLWRDGSVVDLGVLPGDTSSEAIAINSEGLVVGESRPGNESSEVHAVIWNPADGSVSDIGSLSSANITRPYDINTAGQIVGASDVAGGVLGVEFSEHAFLYRDGTMMDLNDLIDPDTGWLLISADAINDQGQIAATGVPVGSLQSRAVLLTLIDQPTGGPTLPGPADPELLNWIDFVATQTMTLFDATDAFVVQCRQAGRFFADRFGSDVAALLASVTVESLGLFFSASISARTLLRDGLRAMARPGLTPGAQANLLALAQERGYRHFAAYLAAAKRSATPHAAILAPAWYVQIAEDEILEDLASRAGQLGFEQLLGDLFRRGEALGEAAASTSEWLTDYRGMVDAAWNSARDQAPPAGDLATLYGEHLQLIAHANEIVLANAQLHGAMLISAWESERSGDDSLGRDIASLLLRISALALAFALGGIPFLLVAGALAIIAVTEDADQVSETDRLAFMATSLIFASAEAAMQIQMNAYNGMAQIADSGAYPAQPRIARGEVSIARAAVREGGDSYSEIAVENTGQDRATFEVTATYGKRIPRLLGLAPHYADFFIPAEPQILEPGERGLFRLDYRRDGKGEEPASVSSGEVGTFAVRVEVLGSTETGRYHVGSANVEWRP